ncbi:hypothetical protein BDQ17DRAFT_1356976 [Cyathus striatus]|nr:hypothetical protein BDQ17DRAFT_1356976 [Cyathus striatus]
MLRRLFDTENKNIEQAPEGVKRDSKKYKHSYTNSEMNVPITKIWKKIKSSLRTRRSDVFGPSPSFPCENDEIVSAFREVMHGFGRIANELERNANSYGPLPESSLPSEAQNNDSSGAEGSDILEQQLESTFQSFIREVHQIMRRGPQPVAGHSQVGGVSRLSQPHNNELPSERTMDAFPKISSNHSIPNAPRLPYVFLPPLDDDILVNSFSRHIPNALQQQETGPQLNASVEYSPALSCYDDPHVYIPTADSAGPSNISYTEVPRTIPEAFYVPSFPDVFSRLPPPGDLLMSGAVYSSGVHISKPTLPLPEDTTSIISPFNVPQSEILHSETNPTGENAGSSEDISNLAHLEFNGSSNDLSAGSSTVSSNLSSLASIDILGLANILDVPRQDASGIPVVTPTLPYERGGFKMENRMISSGPMTSLGMEMGISNLSEDVNTGSRNLLSISEQRPISELGLVTITEVEIPPAPQSLGPQDNSPATIPSQRSGIEEEEICVMDDPNISPKRELKECEITMQRFKQLLCQHGDTLEVIDVTLADERCAEDTHNEPIPLPCVTSLTIRSSMPLSRLRLARTRHLTNVQLNIQEQNFPDLGLCWKNVTNVVLYCKIEASRFVKLLNELPPQARVEWKGGIVSGELGTLTNQQTKGILT